MWYKLANKKALIIMRGLPGSGKSTKAKQLGEGGIILGSDDFWGPEYNFDISKLGEAHRWNQNRALDALKKGISPIVIDNTNVSFYEFRPYVEMAQSYGYEISFQESDAPWKFDVEELTRRNTHQVPAERIQDMLDRWDLNPNIESVLKSVAPWEQDNSH